MSVRPELRWTLGLSLALTLVALIWAPPSGVTLSASRQGTQMPALELPVSNSAGYPRQTMPREARNATRPERLERREFTSVQVDLFAGRQAPPDTQKTAQPVLPPTSPAELQGPPIPPRPPAVSARFYGLMRTPQGEALIYLREGEQVLLARPGSMLPSGYQVEAFLTEERNSQTDSQALATPSEVVAVGLIYPPLKHREVLRLPKAGAL